MPSIAKLNNYGKLFPAQVALAMLVKMMFMVTMMTLTKVYAGNADWYAYQVCFPKRTAMVTSRLL